MSTALIGGLALQGTPQDYSNVAARREQAAGRGAAQAQRERDALDKQILGALRADAHPALLEELEGANSEGMRRVYDLYAGGDLNAAQAALIQLKNNNDHVARTSKQLYEFERFSSQGGYHFPPGWSEFVRSPEFRAGGESRIKAAEEFFNREENQAYKSLFGVGLDSQGRFTIAYDANVGKKVDADNVFTSKANKLMGQAFIQGLGETVNSQKFRHGGTNVLQNVQRLSVDRGVEIFDQEAANPAFLYNAAMSEQGLFAPKDSEEYDAARRRFVERNLPVNVRDYIDRFRFGSGSSRDVVGQVTEEYTVPFGFGSQFKNYRIPAFTPVSEKLVMLNFADGSFVFNEKAQYSRTTPKEGQANQNVKVAGVAIVPVYMGANKTINTGVLDDNNEEITIQLVNGAPLPVEEMNALYSRDSKAARAIGDNVTYKYDAFIIGEGQGREGTGSSTDTHMIPMTDANREKLFVATKDGRFTSRDWKKSIFGGKSNLIGRTGRVGGGQGRGTSSGGGQQRQQAAPAPQTNTAPIPTVRQASGQGSQQEGRVAPKLN